MTSHARTVWRRWLHFWFAPGDPTTMSFIRVVTGCVVLYVHLAYLYDLTAFFGRTGWYDLETANRERREAVGLAPSFWQWEHQQAVSWSARLPDAIPRRQAVAAWLKGLPAGDRDALARSLKLLDPTGVLESKPTEPGGRPDAPPQGVHRPDYPPDVYIIAPAYLLALSPVAETRANTLRALVNKPLRDAAREQVPDAFDRLDDAARGKLAADLEALYQTLPQGQDVAAGDARRYVCNYLTELGGMPRDNLLAFLRDLTAVSAGERAERLDFLTYWNYERRHATVVGVPTFSVWFHVTEPGEMYAMHAVILLVIVMFTLGLWTRVTSVLTWLLTVGFMHRNPYIVFGQDTMMNILLVYLMVANSGATLSLDRLFARYRAARASLRRSGRIDAPTAAFLASPPPSPASAFAQRLLQVHFCFIYLASGLSKLKGDTWWNNNAMWDTLVNPEFTMVHFEWYQGLMRAIVGARPVYAVLASAGVAFTLATEIGLPFLVWTRRRPLAVGMGLMLHLGIGVMMGLLVFTLFMMTMLVGFLPGAAIRERLFGPPPATRQRRPVDAGSAEDCRSAAWAVAWDSTGKLELVPGNR